MTVATKGPVRVVGTGLLGASVGLALTREGVEVQLSDPSRTALALARDVGAGSPARADDPEPALVVVAAPPDVTADVVRAELAAHPHAVVTDVASVKGYVLEELRAAGADLTRYVGSHPMAGRERSGPAAAVPDLFLGRPWVIADSGSSDPDALLAVRSLAVDLGAVPVAMDAAEHDAAVAAVSHLPQLAASLVAARLRGLDEPALGLAGQGLRDVTRIAASDPGLWVQILGANAGKIVEHLYGVREDVERLIRTLEAPTAPGARLDLAQLMSEGNAGQARIPGKHGGPPQAFAWLTVLVDDRPGQIARLLTEIGEIGVNLEDLRLDHSSGRNVGMVELSVLPSKHDALVAELEERGWRVLQ